MSAAGVLVTLREWCRADRDEALEIHRGAA
jgi:hypothetical protein